MKIVRRNLDLLSKCQSFKFYCLSYGETVRGIVKCVEVLYKIGHFPANSVIAKLIVHNLDLLFEGLKFQLLICLKR